MRKLKKRQELLFECLTKKNAEGKLNKKKHMKLNYLLHSHDKNNLNVKLTYAYVNKNKQKNNMIARHTLQWNELAVS